MQPKSILLTHSTHLLRTVWADAIASSGAQAAIDATAGRGSDTLTLCTLLGNKGIVHAFDVQSSAILETNKRYVDLRETTDEIATLHVHHECHSRLRETVIADDSDMPVACVTYNLGWYPGQQADRSIITKPETTLASLEAASELLAPGGVISVMGYVGHNGGAQEEAEVRQWASKLDSRTWTVAHMTYPNRNQAPTILLCQRTATQP